MKSEELVERRSEHARLSALVEVRLQELLEALRRHEDAGRWDRTEDLERVERALADLVETLW